MKRLIKKAFEQTLYHGTNIENLTSITQVGMIVPQESDGDGISSEVVKDIITDQMIDDGIEYKSDEFEEKYQEYFDKEVERQKSAYEGYTFFAKTINKAKEYCSTQPLVVIEASLPKESLMPDDNDCPDCKTWQESLQHFAQVKVLGTITDDYITGVYIFEDNNDSEGVFYPKLTWINEYK